MSVRRSLIGLAACLLLTVASAVPAAASDAATAQKLVITPTDVGAGYASAPRVSSPVLFPKIAACVGKSIAGRKVTAIADGPDLTNTADGTTIRSSVDIVQTKAMAKADLRVLKSAKFADCMKQVLSDDLSSQGIEVVYVTPNPLLARQKYGTFTRAFDVQLKQFGGSFIHVVEVGIVKGRAEIDASITSSGGSADVTSFLAVLDKFAKRLKKARV